MVDAYADLLRSPELLHHLLTGFPLDVLLSEVTCGNVGVEGAVIVPAANFTTILGRLEEPFPKGEAAWRARSRRTTFLSTRCDEQFLRMWVARDPDRLDRLAEPGLMLEADPNNELVARLNEFGLFPEEMRRQFAAHLIEYCVTGVDPAVLWNERLASILSTSERDNLLEAVRSVLLGNLRRAISNCTDHWSRSDGSPESAVEPLRSLVYYLPRTVPNDAVVEERARELDRLLDEWVAEQDWDDPDEGNLSRPAGGTTTTPPAVTRSIERSMFDDLLDGRQDGS